MPIYQPIYTAAHLQPFCFPACAVYDLSAYTTSEFALTESQLCAIPGDFNERSGPRRFGCIRQCDLGNMGCDPIHVRLQSASDAECIYLSFTMQCGPANGSPCLSAGPLPGAANHTGSPQQMGGRVRATHIPALVYLYRQYEGVPCTPEADAAVHSR